MKISLKLFNPSGTVNRICNNEKVGKFLAETWGRIFEKYVPADQLILTAAYRTTPFQVEYYMPYSHYQWYGVNRFSGNPLNYQKEQHPLATSHWEEHAQRERANEVAAAVTQYMKGI